MLVLIPTDKYYCHFSLKNPLFAVVKTIKETTAGKNAEENDCRVPSFNGYICSVILSLRLREHVRRRGGMVVRTRVP